MPFKDASEVYDYIGGVFKVALAREGLGDKLAASGVILQLRYSEPDAVITVDMPNREVSTGETELKPTVVLTSKAEAGHKFWLGKLNLTVALARGEVKARGPVTKLLKLVPIASQLFPEYRQILEERGRQDLIAEAG